MNAECIEDIGKVQGQSIRETLEGKKGGSLVFVWGLGFLLRPGVCVPSGIQEPFRTKAGAQVSFLRARGLGIKMSSTSGLE